jgi:AICAR transformylase/IMP cyclohydrolase PurH
MVASRPFIPKCMEGLLGLRDNPDHVKVMAEHGIEAIDLVVVNLYQFEKTVSKEGVTLEEAIENIDIGGPPCCDPPQKISRMSPSLWIRMTMRGS